MNKYAEAIVNRILSCSDAKFVTEIYAKERSIVNGEFGNWVGLMVEVDPEFTNESLYDVINDMEEEKWPFTLVISVEPDTVERGHGTILWNREG